MILKFLQDDLVVLSLSVGLAVCYFIYLLTYAGRKPDSAIHQFNIKVREHWVEMVLNTDNSGILAVQTLRNSVMAASFMASTSILLIIATLNLADNKGGWKALNMENVGVNGATINLWEIKLGLLLMIFFVAFFCFSIAIRLFTHVGYLITLPKGEKDHQELQKYSCAYLNRAKTYYAVGSRAFYFCLPAIFWFFGPCYMLVTTVLLIGALLMLDKIPR